MTAAIPIIVAVLNAIGPPIVQWLQQAFSHPDLNDNGKAALAALGVTLKQDILDVEALKPLPVPEPKPTPNERPTPPGGES